MKKLCYRNYLVFQFMLDIICSPVLYFNFLQAESCYSFPSFTRCTSFTPLLVDSCSHIHPYWPVHGQYDFWYMISVPCKLVKLQAQPGIVSLMDSIFSMIFSSAGFCLLILLVGNTTIFQNLLNCLGGIQIIFRIDICILAFHSKFFLTM